RHNFTELPRIRSERPAFELHYPHMVERMRTEAHITWKTGSSRVHLERDPAARAPSEQIAGEIKEDEASGHLHDDT
ncbi:hypothetical protein AN948_00215, partial [Rhodococcus sp. ADH]